MTSIRQRKLSAMLRRGRSGVLRVQLQPVVWRLDVREDSNDRGMFLPEERRARRRGKSSHRRLISYISAGGMRDLQPSRTADIEDRRRRFVIGFTLVVLALWLVFLLLPSP